MHITAQESCVRELPALSVIENAWQARARPSAKATLKRRSSSGFLRGFWVKSLRISGYGQGYGVSGYGWGEKRAAVSVTSHTQLCIIITQTHAPGRCRASHDHLNLPSRHQRVHTQVFLSHLVSVFQTLPLLVRELLEHLSQRLSI